MLESVQKEIINGIEWIKKNWKSLTEFQKIFVPSDYKKEEDVLGNTIVILILNRQKPSEEREYDYNEERIGITASGKILWGFDSGCSCPIPWEDNAPFYNVEKDWKSFRISALEQFDSNVLEDITSNIRNIKNKIKIPNNN